MCDIPTGTCVPRTVQCGPGLVCEAPTRCCFAQFAAPQCCRPDQVCNPLFGCA
jgi:hypothetical protein